ncbi:unnamed protein product [Schistosoma curassoni]|uniref:Reverse transcriptase domain-containing protein n=1 Tax=Schistosoma curassoni TaxID=6186 RepID=A0A183KZS1_9TREM|nr:unnamed protein product [Schistosoma curassoni]
MYATLALSIADKRRYAELIVDGVHIQLQLDRASDITLTSKRTWNLIGCLQVLPTEHTARNGSGDILRLVGMIKCSVEFRGNYFTGDCYLTNRHDLDLIGIHWIDKLSLWDVPLSEICTMKSGDSPGTAILEVCSVEGSNPFIPEAKRNICKFSGSQQDNILLTAHEIVKIPDD